MNIFLVAKSYFKLKGIDWYMDGYRKIIPNVIDVCENIILVTDSNMETRLFLFLQ